MARTHRFESFKKSMTTYAEVQVRINKEVYENLAKELAALKGITV